MIYVYFKIDIKHPGVTIGDTEGTHEILSNLNLSKSDAEAILTKLQNLIKYIDAKELPAGCTTDTSTDSRTIPAHFQRYVMLLFLMWDSNLRPDLQIDGSPT